MVPVVFVDTNALVAMLCFPRPSSGRLPLAHEVADAEAAGECRLLIGDLVTEELRKVVERDFPAALPELQPFLDAFGVTRVPTPSAELLEEAERVCPDPDDAPILAAAVVSAERFGATILLSNDIETFHSDAVKEFPSEHGLVVVTLFGLLKLLGRRA